MQIKILKISPIASIVLLIIVTFFFQPSPVGGAPIVNTDKDIYNSGEMIKVNFSNAPGHTRDWICIVPVGSPDTEGGDYKHMPNGLSQGVLTFDPRSPGKYEVRAYYNYSRNGYVVSARYGFSVGVSVLPSLLPAPRKQQPWKNRRGRPFPEAPPVTTFLFFILRPSIWMLPVMASQPPTP
jgi:hypothetical protein